MEWFGFWIFLSVLVACDTWLFSKGYNSFIWTWKTEKEKEIREAIIAQEKAKANEQKV